MKGSTHIVELCWKNSAIGEPIVVPRDAPMDKLENYRLQMQYATNALMAESKLLLGSPED